MGVVGKTSTSGGPNKAHRVGKAAQAYLKKDRALEKKVREALASRTSSEAADLARLVQLAYYHQMLTKHIDLVDRRLIKAEKIPHSEKVFS